MERVLALRRKPLFFAIVVGPLVGAILGELVVRGDAKDVIGVLVVALACALFWYRPLWGFALVAAGAMFTAVRINGGVGHWRIDQVLGALSVLGTIRLRLHIRDIGPVGWAALGWILVNGLASLFAVDVFASEKIVVWLVTDFLVFLYVRAIVKCYGMQSTLRIVLAVSAGELVVGMVLYALHHGSGYRATGTMLEADIFGTFSAATAMSALAWARDHPWWGYALFSLGTAGVLFSGTRSALTALAVGLLVWSVASRGNRRSVAVMVTVLMLPVGLAYSALSSQLVGRLQNFSRASTLASRLVTVREALAGVATSTQHLLIGHGTNSFGQTHLAVLNGILVPNYLGVQLVTVLYDTGLVGALAFLLILWLAGRAFCAARRHSHEVLRFGAICGLLALFVGDQATQGVWFAYSWIYLAFLDTLM